MGKNLPASMDSLVKEFFRTMKLMRSYYPFVLCVEGPDGVGKTTLIKHLENHLDSHGPLENQKNVAVIKYPTRELYDTLVNGDVPLTNLERALLYIADGVVTPEEMDTIYLHYSVIILDRHPLFSVPVYNLPKLSETHRNLAAYTMGLLSQSMIIPNLTIVLQNKPYAEDDTYAANILPKQDIVNNYKNLIGDGSLRESLVNTWPELNDVNYISELDQISLAKPFSLGYDEFDYNTGCIIQMMTETRENI